MHKRPGARLHVIETVFCSLPKQHRTVEVWRAMTEVGGFKTEGQKKAAAEHMRLALAVTHGG
jgi:hypothetical protein